MYGKIKNPKTGRYVKITGKIGIKILKQQLRAGMKKQNNCLLYTSPSPRDPKTSRMPSSA